MPLEYDPMSPADLQDPYPTYRRLRDEAPVHYSPASQVYCISRYEDVAEALRSPELFSSASAFDVLFRELTRNLGVGDVAAFVRFAFKARMNPFRLSQGPQQALIMLDPPRHDELRNIVNRGFTPRRVQAWRERIEEIVDASMAAVEGNSTLDVVRDLAIPLPVEVIAEVIGIDGSRRSEFKDWTNRVIAGLSGTDRKRARRAFLAGLGEMASYINSVIAVRRKDPREDLISVLVDPRHGEVLDEGAINQFVLLLLIAGNETTTNLIGNTTMALLEHPQELARAVEAPEMIPNLVEEGLRYDGPLQFLFRRATQDVEVAGTTIPVDSRVALLLGSANRDERQFEDPDRFDVGRDSKGHLGFGLGPHFCLGSSLARLEAQTALSALVPLLPDLKAKEDSPPLVDSVLVRGRQRIELLRA